jgi:hypothetical protein
VVAEHFEGDLPAGIGQSDAAVRGVLDQIKLSEPSDHFGHRRWFHPQSAREGLGAHPVSLPAEEKDLFEVVLLGLRQHQSRFMIHTQFRHIFRLT